MVFFISAHLIIMEKIPQPCVLLWHYWYLVIHLIESKGSAETINDFSSHPLPPVTHRLTQKLDKNRNYDYKSWHACQNGSKGWMTSGTAGQISVAPVVPVANELHRAQENAWGHTDDVFHSGSGAFLTNVSAPHSGPDDCSDTTQTWCWNFHWKNCLQAAHQGPDA